MTINYVRDFPAAGQAVPSQGRPVPAAGPSTVLTPLPIAAAHFERWVALFQATVDEHFVGPTADEAKLRGQAIAQVFEARMRERGPLSIL